MVRRITMDDMLTDNSDTDDVTTQLLMATPFDLTYTPTNMINSVYRPTKEDSDEDTH